MSEPRNAVLVDVDGTLVDSNNFHTVAWWRAFPQAGDDVAMSKIHPPATAAGLKCVAVLTGGTTRADLEDAGAVAVYEDVADLLDHLDDSPLATLLER